MIGGNLKGGVYGNLAQNSSTIKDISSTTTSFGNASYEDSTTTGAFEDRGF